MDVRIEDIENGYIVYDSVSLETFYYKTIPKTIKAVETLLKQNQEDKDA